MSLGKEDQELLICKKTLNITKEESNLLRSLNSGLTVVRNVHMRGWDVNEDKIRAKKKDRENIDRLTVMLDVNIMALKNISAVIGINYALASSANTNTTDKTVLNNLQLYELRFLIIENLKNKENSAYQKRLESILTRIQDVLTWGVIGDIDAKYNKIELGLYRRIITGQQDSATM